MHSIIDFLTVKLAEQFAKENWSSLGFNNADVDRFFYNVYRTDKQDTHQLYRHTSLILEEELERFKNLDHDPYPNSMGFYKSYIYNPFTEDFYREQVMVGVSPYGPVFKTYLSKRRYTYKRTKVGGVTIDRRVYAHPDVIDRSDEFYKVPLEFLVSIKMLAVDCRAIPQILVKVPASKWSVVKNKLHRNFDTDPQLLAHFSFSKLRTVINTTAVSMRRMLSTDIHIGSKAYIRGQRAMIGNLVLPF